MAQDAATKKYVDDTVAIPSGTDSLSIAPPSWTTIHPDTAEITIAGAYIQADADGISFDTPVFLPHGAVVTGCIVEGNAAATAETWTLYRTTIDGASGDLMGTANIGTADTIISEATIDNENYFYLVSTTSLDTDDRINGTRITYTL